MPPKLTNPCSNQEVSYDLSSNARTSVRFRFQEERLTQNPYEGWLDARARGLVQEISPCFRSGSSIPRIRRSCPPLWSPPWPQARDHQSCTARLSGQPTKQVPASFTAPPPAGMPVRRRRLTGALTNSGRAGRWEEVGGLSCSRWRCRRRRSRGRRGQ
jgi:hypothetical protein